MKKLIISLLTVLLSTATLLGTTKVTQTITHKANKVYILANNREYEALPIVSVKFLNQTNLLNSYNVIRYNKLNYADIETPSNISISNFVSLLENDTNIIEIDYNSEGEYNTFIPNDTYWTSQWYLSAINITQAWNITTGDRTIKVAVLDSGTDWVHGDLGTGYDQFENIYCNGLENDWTYKGDPTSGNHIDDDLNGYIDDYKGWNFDLNTNDSRGTFYHGTLVAGIIGAKTNNNYGIAGIAGGNNSPGVSIMPYCVGINNPNSSIIDDAIIAAVDNGARIIQFSLGCQESNPIKAALQYAKSNDVIVVCASGNSNTTISFPASDTTVVAVGAMDENYQRAYFSNYGTNLRLTAPGVNIFGLNLTTEQSQFTQQNGTSFSAPQVSGIMALMLSVNPYLHRNQVINIIESTAQKVGGYSYTTYSNHPNGTWNNEMGYGLVDAYAAVMAAKACHPIQGLDYVCDTTKYYFKDKPSNATISWSVHNGNITHPSYSIVGSANQDTVYIRCEYVVPAMREEEESEINNLTGGRPIVDNGKWLSATISESGVSTTYQKGFRYPLGDIPTVTASSSSTWYSNTPRTFTITNCLDVPDSALTWKVVKKTTSSLGVPVPTVTNNYTGRSITYSTIVPPKATCQVTITATNTQKECEEKSTTLTYTIVRANQLLTNIDNGILKVSIQEMDERQSYFLELWNPFYGCIKTLAATNYTEQINVNGLPQGVYVLVLKENGDIVSETKVQIP